MKTCSTCAHWFRHLADPQDLAAPPAGECRQGPPQLIVAPAVGPLGQSGMALQLAYPGTPPDFPACSQHQERP